MFDVTLKMDLMKDLEKRLTDLAKSHVSVGMFIEQGEHESGFSYVGLFRYHAHGDESRRLPARAPLWNATQITSLKRSGLPKDLARYLSSLTVKKTPDKLLNNLGKHYRDTTREVFGNDSILAPKANRTQEMSQSPNTPLIETGELAKKISFKVNKGAVQEVGR